MPDQCMPDNGYVVSLCPIDKLVGCGVVVLVFCSGNVIRFHYVFSRNSVILSLKHCFGLIDNACVSHSWIGLVVFLTPWCSVRITTPIKNVADHGIIDVILFERWEGYIQRRCLLLIIIRNKRIGCVFPFNQHIPVFIGNFEPVDYEIMDALLPANANVTDKSV